MNGFVAIITPILGVFTISHHIRNRSIKMVITKPCLPETWLLSSLLSPVIVCAILHIVIFLISASLFMIWGIPFQWGLLYISLDSFFKATIWLSYLIFLGSIFHPVVAILFALIIHEGTFYVLIIWIMAGIELVEAPVHETLLQYLKPIFYLIYMILPTEPFSDKALSISTSLRPALSDLKYLFFTSAYTLVITSFFYLLAAYFLKKKRFI
jgi:ABC-type transport system involved in multi-copper enzyme maturation permease subunit